MKFAGLGACPTKASKNLEFLRINLEFLKDCFASLAMTKILEFLREFRIPYRDPRVKPEDDIVVGEF